MKNPVKILIVDNDHARNSEKERIIQENKLSCEVKVAMNAGHALLYLDHIHLNKKIHDSHLLIILNMDTPICNGYDFLSAYHNSSNLKKDRIHIIIVNENLCEEKKAKIKKYGVSEFIPDSFPADTIKAILEERFNDDPAPKKAQQTIAGNNFQPHAAAGV